MKVCVLGLGNMGLPVAVNLVRAGHDVTGTARAEVPAATGAGVRVSTDPADALRDREVVLCLLPDLPQLEPMLPALIDGGATELVVMSTVSPTGVRDLARRLRGRVEVMDACMSGGVAKATDGTMSIMCGASEEVFERLRPLLGVIGGTVERMGGVGAGAVTKACNQLVVAGTLVALAEATVLAKDNDLDAGRVLDVLERAWRRPSCCGRSATSWPTRTSPPAARPGSWSRTSPSRPTAPAAASCPRWRSRWSCSAASPMPGWAISTTRWCWSTCAGSAEHFAHLCAPSIGAVAEAL